MRSMARSLLLREKCRHVCDGNIWTLKHYLFEASVGIRDQMVKTKSAGMTSSRFVHPDDDGSVTKCQNQPRVSMKATSRPV
jgi:hypothetical protein